MSSMTRITATAARKAAKALGDNHPAVIDWRRIASGRVARINNVDATNRAIAVPDAATDAALEDAKRRLVEAAGL